MASAEGDQVEIVQGLPKDPVPRAKDQGTLPSHLQEGDVLHRRGGLDHFPFNVVGRAGKERGHLEVVQARPDHASRRHARIQADQELHRVLPARHGQPGQDCPALQEDRAPAGDQRGEAGRLFSLGREAEEGQVEKGASDLPPVLPDALGHGGFLEPPSGSRG